VAGVSGVTALSSGADASCAVLTNATVECWGSNGDGQLGNGHGSLPAVVTSLSGVTKVAVGFRHSCAVLTNTTVKCWGEGDLGDGIRRIFATAKPITVGLSGVTAINAGADDSCALLSDHTVECWGEPPVGDGTPDQRLFPTSLRETNYPPRLAVSTIGAAAGTVTSDVAGINCGTTCSHHYTWDTPVVLTATPAPGYFFAGWAGDSCSGTGTCSLSMRGDANVIASFGQPMSGVTAIANGDRGFSCARKSDGTVRCWGNNFFGQLGNGTTNDGLRPGPVADLSDATAIAASYNSVCAVRTTTAVACWGENAHGELGDGTSTHRSMPVGVLGLTGATAIAAGQPFFCALMSDTTVKCWGDNGSGELGNGSAVSKSATPVAVSGLSGVTAISAGPFDACALLANTTVKCWGSDFGSTPVAISGLTGVTAISGTCGLMGDATVRCWGQSPTPTTPVAITGVTDVAALGTGGPCGVLTDGTAECWSVTNASPPTQLAGISNATAVATNEHDCALLTDTTMVCVGNNQFGQLGNGTRNPRSTPFPVFE
jgi:alpha-tubulin suppressor-like RCC1 family protein